MNDRTIDTAETIDELRQLIRECEVTGRRTVFTRTGHPVAILVSHDEYLALRETVELSAEPDVLRDIELGEDQARRGELMLPEDLFVE